ncbi:MAG: ABC transporter substrate-binding protein [Betaproteobacteria bacterium]
MRRRTLIALGLGIGFCPPALPRKASAQSTKIYRIGFLEAGSASANPHFLDAFRGGLRERGYVEGTNVVIDARWAEGRADRFPEFLAELVKLRSDVIVVASSVGAQAARKVVKSTPVVFVGVSDPVGLGVVANLSRPGGNLTGLSRVFGEGLLGKALQLLKEIVPRASRVAILWNPAGAVETRVREAEAAMRTLDMTPLPIEMRDLRGLDGNFSQMRKTRVDALLVVTDPLTLRYRQAIVNLAAANRIPAVYEFAEFARAGGLIAYSTSVPALFERAAGYVDKILKGADPGTLPIEQPTKFDLVINLKTAKAMGLTVPQSLLLRADEVIQ